MSWYSLDLGDGVEANVPSQRIQEAWQAAYIAHGGLPHDAAVFSRYDHDANVVTAYFSPAASHLAESFGAAPCDPPKMDGEPLALLVGDQRAPDLLFPGERPSRRS